MSEPTAVELTGITKRFPGVVANDDVHLRVAEGEIHAVVGENGAGKSTLMKILYGMLPPDEGTMAVGGDDVRFTSPAEAIAAGIGMVHQHFMLADNLTVLENVILGAEPRRRGSGPLQHQGPGGLLRPRPPPGRPRGDPRGGRTTAGRDHQGPLQGSQGAHP